jgi:hypothetical protein
MARHGLFPGYPVGHLARRKLTFLRETMPVNQIIKMLRKTRRSSQAQRVLRDLTIMAGSLLGYRTRLPAQIMAWRSQPYQNPLLARLKRSSREQYTCRLQIHRKKQVSHCLARLYNQKSHSSDSVRLQVVVYVYRPFIYTFLFDSTTSTLSDPSIYHSIHHHLGPLQKPLSASTSTSTAETRINSLPEFNTKSQKQANPVYDLVFDPHNLSIRSSIPNIPGLTSHNQRIAGTSSLSRVETISIHHRVLTTYIETRSRPLELERTCKTSRGWWIVWVRVPTSPNNQQDSPEYSAGKDKPQEAFIVRLASDHAALSGHTRNASSIGGGSGARFFRDLGGASSPGSSQTLRIDIAPSKLVEGLGLDARRYIENLLSLNR